MDCKVAPIFCVLGGIFMSGCLNATVGAPRVMPMIGSDFSTVGTEVVEGAQREARERLQDERVVVLSSEEVERMTGVDLQRLLSDIARDEPAFFGPSARSKSPLAKLPREWYLLRGMKTGGFGGFMVHQKKGGMTDVGWSIMKDSIVPLRKKEAVVVAFLPIAPSDVVAFVDVR